MECSRVLFRSSAGLADREVSRRSALANFFSDTTVFASIVGVLIFFFQAEDGIRDYKVTGVQTCALPIYLMDGKAEHGVALLQDERVTPEPDKMKLPEDPAVVEGHLPALVLLRRHRRGPEQDDPGDTERSHCTSTFDTYSSSSSHFISVLL